MVKKEKTPEVKMAIEGGGLESELLKELATVEASGDVYIFFGGKEKVGDRVYITGVKARRESNGKTTVQIKFELEKDRKKEEKLEYPYKNIHQVSQGKIGEDKLMEILKDPEQVKEVKRNLGKVLNEVYSEEVKMAVKNTLDSVSGGIEKVNVAEGHPLVIQYRYVIEGINENGDEEKAVISNVLVIYKTEKGLWYLLGSKIEATTEKFARTIAKELGFSTQGEIENMPTTLNKLIGGQKVNWLKVSDKPTEEARKIFEKYLSFKPNEENPEVERKYEILGDSLDEVLENINGILEVFGDGKIKLKHKVDIYYNTPPVITKDKGELETNFRIRFSGSGWGENYKKRLVTLKLKNKNIDYRDEIEGGIGKKVERSFEEAMEKIHKYLPCLKLKKLPENLSEVPDQVGRDSEFGIYKKLGTIDKYMIVKEVKGYEFKYNGKTYYIDGSIEVSFLVIPEKKVLVPVVEFEVEGVYRKVGDYLIKVNKEVFQEVGDKVLDKFGEEISKYATKVKWKNKKLLENIVGSKKTIKIDPERMKTYQNMYNSFESQKAEMAEVTYWTKKK